jgi:hypothetical protein
MPIGLEMTDHLATAITTAASKQTAYTIRFLVDQPLVDQAFRAYAYFRWVDDQLDAEAPNRSVWRETDRARCRRFLDRQQSLLEACLRGDAPRAVGPEEAMLVELLRHGDRSDGGLETYLRHMMQVMEFDVVRRGRLVSGAELDAYTRHLAIAVTEAMQTFIGHRAATPRDETRYLAASGAHILHMLRDTLPDVRAGYYNVPREILESARIGPGDVHCDAYRAWVEDRVRLARTDLDAGRAFFGAAECRRFRLAGLAYVARFEWLIATLERDEFRLRPAYPDRNGIRRHARTAWHVLSSLIAPRPRGRDRRALAGPGARR